MYSKDNIPNQANEELKVKDSMTTDVITVRRSMTLKEIIKLFKEYNHHILPVIDNDNKLVGLITLDDILNIFQPYSSNLAQMLEANPLIDYAYETDVLSVDISPDLGTLVVADDIMSTKLPTIDPEATIMKAYTTMRLENTEKLLVVKEKKLVGILALFDIILALFREKGVI